MNTLEFNELELINGGGACEAGAVAGGVVAAAGAAAHFGWLVLTPIGPGILIGAGLALAAGGLYCAFS